MKRGNKCGILASSEAFCLNNQGKEGNKRQHIILQILLMKKHPEKEPENDWIGREDIIWFPIAANIFCANDVRDIPFHLFIFIIKKVYVLRKGYEIVSDKNWIHDISIWDLGRCNCAIPASPLRLSWSLSFKLDWLYNPNENNTEEGKTIFSSNMSWTWKKTPST